MTTDPKQDADEAELEAAEPADAAPEKIPVIEIPQSDLMNELSVLATLITAGLAKGHRDARRLFREVGVLVNDVPIHSDKAKLRLSDVSAEGLVKLSLGADQHVFLRPI